MNTPVTDLLLMFAAGFIVALIFIAMCESFLMGDDDDAE
jgi:hypothetical protein